MFGGAAPRRDGSVGGDGEGAAAVGVGKCVIAVHWELDLLSKWLICQMFNDIRRRNLIQSWFVLNQNKTSK